MTFTADLHTHTRFSHDSLSRPEDVLDAAMRRGLSAIAITDHNEVRGALAAQGIAKRRKLALQVIVGEEVATDAGDLLLYFVKERIEPGKLSHVIERAHAQGALCAAAHPFDFARHGINLRALLPETLYGIDAIEAFNARVPLASQNHEALRFAIERQKPQLCGSDAHHPSEVGAAYAEFSGVKRLDAKSLLFAERKIVGRRSSPLVRFYSRYASASKRLSRLFAR
jgi:predicted metal-dependent phosphoesterase TrpH